MYIYSEANRQRELRRERANAVVRNLVFSILVKTDEELADNPASTGFSAPLTVDSPAKQRICTKLLGSYPEAITRRLEPRIGREILLRLDESVEPPILHVELGDHLPKK